MPDLPHWTWPMSYTTGPDGNPTTSTTEQASGLALEADAALIASTRRGTGTRPGQRADDPTWGVTTPLFDNGPVDTDRLASEIEQSSGGTLDIDAEQAAGLLTRVADIRLSVLPAEA